MGAPCVSRIGQNPACVSSLLVFMRSGIFEALMRKLCMVPDCLHPHFSSHCLCKNSYDAVIRYVRNSQDIVIRAVCQIYGYHSPHVLGEESDSKNGW